MKPEHIEEIVWNGFNCLINCQKAVERGHKNIAIQFLQISARALNQAKQYDNGKKGWDQYVGIYETYYNFVVDKYTEMFE